MLRGVDVCGLVNEPDLAFPRFDLERDAVRADSDSKRTGEARVIWVSGWINGHINLPVEQNISAVPPNYLEVEGDIEATAIHKIIPLVVYVTLTVNRI